MSNKNNKKINELSDDEIIDEYRKCDITALFLRAVKWLSCSAGILAVGFLSGPAKILAGISTIALIIALGEGQYAFSKRANNFNKEIKNRGLEEKLKQVNREKSLIGTLQLHPEEWQEKEPQISPVFKRENKKQESPFPEFEKDFIKPQNNISKNEINEEQIQR